MPKAVTANVMAQRENAETVDYFHLTWIMASFKPFYTEDQSFRQTDLVIKSMEKIPALSNTELTDRKTHSEREENQRMTAGVRMIRSFTDSLQPFVHLTKKQKRSHQ